MPSVITMARAGLREERYWWDGDEGFISGDYRKKVSTKTDFFKS